MIFAELQYDQHYSDVHASLVEFIESKFDRVEHGLQGDSWIWVFNDEERVAIDTFSSMQHQVKAEESNSDFVHKVIDALSTEFQVVVNTPPKFE